MVEEVEPFRQEFQIYALGQLERASYAKVNHFLPWTAEPVEGLVRDDGKIQGRGVKYRCIRPSACEGDYGGEHEILKRAPGRRPGAVQHEALRLIQLRRASLAPLIELIEIASALIDRFGERVGEASCELRSRVPPRNQQRVVNGLARIVDGIDGAEIAIENAINRFEFGHDIR